MIIRKGTLLIEKMRSSTPVPTHIVHSTNEEKRYYQIRSLSTNQITLESFDTIQNSYIVENNPFNY